MKILKSIIEILVLLFLAFCIAFFSVLLYVRYIWPYIDYEQILVTMHNLSPHFITDNATSADYFYAFIFFIVAFPLCYYFFSSKGRFIIALFFMGATIYLSGAVTYYVSNNMTSTLYEENYVYPNKLELSFPEKKRNLVLIYLESFEQNFTKEKHYEKNLIPHLHSLQKQGEYSHNHQSISGSDYSIASLVASHCGIPLRYLADRDIYALRYFLPQAICFSDILHQNGYQSAIIKAADITFTNADIFAKSHGYDEALGVAEILEEYPTEEHAALMGTFGGINDEALFSFAKKKIAEFAPDKPFLLTLFSLDTHMPTPHQNPDCPVVFGDLRDVYMCTDNTVYQFINWLKKSPYWENTTVVIMGDHLLPSRIKTKGHPKRGIYNVFLNLPKNLHINSDKVFSTFDMAPTILESLGVTNSQQAFGLGRSLFNNEETLVEKMGASKFKMQIRKNSHIYQQFHKSKKVRENVFQPYAFGERLIEKNFLKYTDAYEEIVGNIYIDRMNLQLPQTNADKITVELRFNTIQQKGGEIVFLANQQEVFRYKSKKVSALPKRIIFDIPTAIINNGKLQLIFRNTSGVSASTLMGISPIDMIINEKISH